MEMKFVQDQKRAKHDQQQSCSLCQRDGVADQLTSQHEWNNIWTGDGFLIREDDAKGAFEQQLLVDMEMKFVQTGLQVNQQQRCRCQRVALQITVDQLTLQHDWNNI